MLRRISITALMLVGAITLARADVYRWVDEKGEPHYSDQWVPGSEVVKTTNKHTSSFESPSPSSQKSLVAGNEHAAQQVAEQENTRAVQQDVARTRESQCKAATARYTQAVQARRVYKTGADGERTFMTDDEADTYREQARKDVQSACGSVPEIDFNAPIEPKPIPEPKVNPADATSE
jgi:hypothetical protein